MTEISDHTMRDMIDTIVREMDPERIILFGSRAHGEARPDSDVDLLVIEKEPYGPDRSRRLRTARLYQALMRFRVPKDIVLCSESEAQFWSSSLNHLLARSMREGVVLYARS